MPPKKMSDAEFAQWVAESSKDPCAIILSERTPIEHEDCISDKIKPYKVVAVMVIVAILSTGGLVARKLKKASEVENLTPVQKSEKLKQRDDMIKAALITAGIAAGIGLGSIKIAQRSMRRDYTSAIAQRQLDLQNPLLKL